MCQLLMHWTGWQHRPQDRCARHMNCGQAGQHNCTRAVANHRLLGKSQLHTTLACLRLPYDGWLQKAACHVLAPRAQTRHPLPRSVARPPTQQVKQGRLPYILHTNPSLSTLPLSLSTHTHTATTRATPVCCCCLRTHTTLCITLSRCPGCPHP